MNAVATLHDLDQEQLEPGQCREISVGPLGELSTGGGRVVSLGQAIDDWGHMIPETQLQSINPAHIYVLVTHPHGCTLIHWEPEQ